jgi:MFS transporter, PPP family, 3-phenylpropionic acid transporter
MLLSTPIWGALADISQRHKVSLLAAIGGALSMVGMLSQLRQFTHIAFAVLFVAFFSAPIIPLVDNSVMALLGSRKDLYGKQRMWGAIGWGVSAPLVGSLADRFGTGFFFLGYLIWLGLGFLVVFGLPIKPVLHRISYSQGIKQLIAKKEWILFLLTVFVSAANLSIITNYLFLFFNDLGANRSMMGWGLSIATISEIPVLFFADRLIKKFGAQGMLFLSLIASIIRSFGYAVSPTPWFALGLQMLHGLTFSGMWAAGVSYASQIAPPGLGATAQSLFFSVVFGLSGIVGGFTGGVLYEVFGGVGMFLWSGSGVFLVTLVFLGLVNPFRAGNHFEKVQ